MEGAPWFALQKLQFCIRCFSFLVFLSFWQPSKMSLHFGHSNSMSRILILYHLEQNHCQMVICICMSRPLFVGSYVQILCWTPCQTMLGMITPFIQCQLKLSVIYDFLASYWLSSYYQPMAIQTADVTDLTLLSPLPDVQGKLRRLLVLYNNWSNGY